MNYKSELYATLHQTFHLEADSQQFPVKLNLLNLCKPKESNTKNVHP